jgi:hypothetical protein
LLFAACFFLLHVAIAQEEEDDRTYNNKWLLSANVGVSNYLGDLGGNEGKGQNFLKDFNWRTARPLGGLSLTYYPAKWISGSLNLNYTIVCGADSLTMNKGSQERWRWYRNLDFTTDVFELFAQADFYPRILLSGKEKRFQPFLSLGFGFFHFDPKTKYNGEWVRLAPLCTEGQGFEEYPDRYRYSLNQFFVPLGGGFRYTLNKKYALSFKVIYRQLFTDYLDDVSQTYINPELFNTYLPPADASIARAIHGKHKKGAHANGPGVQRGDPNDMDTYISVFFSFSYKWRHKTRDEKNVNRAGKARYTN